MHHCVLSVFRIVFTSVHVRAHYSNVSEFHLLYRTGASFLSLHDSQRRRVQLLPLPLILKVAVIFSLTISARLMSICLPQSDSLNNLWRTVGPIVHLASPLYRGRGTSLPLMIFCPYTGIPYGTYS